MNVIRSEKSTPTWPNSHIEGPGKGPFNRNVLGEYQIHIFAQEKTYTRVSGGLFLPPPPPYFGPYSVLQTLTHYHGMVPKIFIISSHRVPNGLLHLDQGSQMSTHSLTVQDELQ